MDKTFFHGFIIGVLIFLLGVTIYSLVSLVNEQSEKRKECEEMGLVFYKDISDYYCIKPAYTFEKDGE